MGAQGLEVICELEEGLPEPMVSLDLIRQVFLNLVRNARDAMDGGGTLRVRTESMRVPGRWRGKAKEKMEEWVVVRVIDTGHGISPENMNQVFDPFFTTKSAERGSGIGLWVSYNIVRMYGGLLEIESEEGRGTSVSMSLPMVRPETENRASANEGMAAVQG